MKKILPMMVLGLFLGSQTVSVSEAGLFHHASKAEVELNWKKQMQLSEGAISENEKDIINEFLENYNEAGGVKINKALSTFLTSKGLDRTARKKINNILLDGKLIGENNNTVKASTIALEVSDDASNDDNGDDDTDVKKEKKKKKDKKKHKKDKKKKDKKKHKKDKKKKKHKQEEDRETEDSYDNTQSNDDNDTDGINDSDELSNEDNE